MERINATTGSYNFIDLFAGAGGLSEGFIQAGFSPVAHVEMNPYAAQTLESIAFPFFFFLSHYKQERKVKGCRNKHFVDLQQLQASLEKQWGVF